MSDRTSKNRIIFTKIRWNFDNSNLYSKERLGPRVTYDMCGLSVSRFFDNSKFPLLPPNRFESSRFHCDNHPASEQRSYRERTSEPHRRTVVFCFSPSPLSPFSLLRKTTETEWENIIYLKKYRPRLRTDLANRHRVPITKDSPNGLVARPVHENFAFFLDPDANRPANACFPPSAQCCPEIFNRVEGFPSAPP